MYSEAWRNTYDDWKLSDPRDHLRDERDPDDEYGPVTLDDRDLDDYVEDIECDT